MRGVVCINRKSWAYDGCGDSIHKAAVMVKLLKEPNMKFIMVTVSCALTKLDGESEI